MQAGEEKLLTEIATTAHAASRLDTVGRELIAEALQRFGVVRLRATGGSMSPAIRGGDVLVVANCSIADLRPGDVILFARRGSLVAHRIRRIPRHSARCVLVTRGDAVWRDDPAVRASAILGRVVAVGRGDVFVAPAACTRFGRTNALIANQWTAMRSRVIPRWTRRLGIIRTAVLRSDPGVTP
jgi:signal peptidase I